MDETTPRQTQHDEPQALRAELERKEAELRELGAALRKAEERERHLEDTRKAMLYMLEDLNETTESVARAKREWEATFDGISDPIFIHDEAFCVVRANRAYADAAGVPFTEIIGRPYYEIFPRLDRPLEMCLKAQERRKEAVEEVALPAIGKVYRVKVYPIRDVEGKSLHFIHIMEDVTEQKQAERQMRQEMETTAHLLMIAEATAHTTDMDRLMARIVQCVSKIVRCDVCLSYLWDKEAQSFQPGQCHGLPPALIPLFRTEPLEEAMAFVREAFAGRRPMVLEPPRDRSLGSALSCLSWLQDMKRMVVVPMMGKEDALGLILCIHRETDPPELTERDWRILDGVSHQVSIALEEARLYKESLDKTLELSRKIETLQVIHEIDRSILSSLEPQVILETATRMVAKVIACDRATIALVDQDRQGFTYAAGFGVPFLSKGLLIPFEDTSATEVVRTGRPQYVANLAEMKRLLPLEKRFLKQGFLSHLRVPLTLQGEIIGTLNIGAKRPSAFTPDDFSTLEKLAGQVCVALENARLFTDLQDLFLGTVKALSEAIDAKSPWTKGHSDRVTHYALTIARELGMGAKDLEDLKIAGLLHDIGKIGTDDIILDKPGRLTEEEYAVVKEHPKRGAELLSPIKQLRHIIPWIRGHHEWWDGTGYPDGLKGEEIPLQARILAVADAFDSMTAQRPYRKTPGQEKAVEELKQYSGTQFDPQVVEALLRVVESGKLQVQESGL